MPSDLVQDRPGDLEFSFNWLVRIRGGANCNVLATLYLPKLLTQQISRMLLGIDLLFEINAVAQLHEFVGITRIAVFACELASTVRIYGPGEWHAAASAAVQKRTHRQGEVLNFMPLAYALAMRGQLGDADQALRLRIWE